MHTTTTKIPYYYKSINWDKLVSEYEPPLEYMEGDGSGAGIKLKIHN